MEKDCSGFSTLHIFFTFVYYKSITSMWFLWVRVLRIFHDSNLTETKKLARARKVERWIIIVHTLSIGPNRPNSRSRSASLTS